MNKKALRVTGFILIIIGIIFFIFGLNALSAFAGSLSFGLFGSAAGGIFQMFIGGACILIGAFMIYASYIGKIFNYVAEETSPGVEKVTKAVGKGFSKGYKGKKK